MARIRTKSIDQSDVGQLGGDLFKPDQVKQRIALIPAFLPKSNLEISDELKKKKEEGDFEAQEQVEEIIDLQESIELGLKAQPPRVKEVKDFSFGGSEPAAGYLYARADSHLAHYVQDQKMSILCKAHEYEKAGREAICCTHADPPSWGGSTQPQEARASYATVLIAYETDHEGDLVILPELKRKKLDDKHTLDFKYQIQTWILSDSRMRAWKEHYKTSPLITSDYVVWLAANKQIKFSAVQGQALWMAKGPILFKKILKEGAAAWDGAARWIGKNFSIEEIDQMYGINQKGSPAKPAMEEKDYDDLLTSS